MTQLRLPAGLNPSTPAMNTPSKTLLFAILLIVGAVGIVFLVNGNNEPPPLFRAATENVTPVAPEPAEALVSEPEEVAPPPVIERTEVSGTSGAEYGQGVKGRLIDPGGSPLPHTKVYLMEGGGMDLVRQMMLTSKGTQIPPVARGESDENGNFALGVAQPDAKKRYEIRAVSDRFVDKNVPNVHIAEGEWYDAGSIQLTPGTTLYGRVMIENSGGMPVPGATVMVKPINFMPGISPTPGREDGLVIEVDHTGGFRMENAPPGVVTVSAVAPGYAMVEKTNVTINENGDNQMLFELPPGVSIGGLVTDRTDNPVPNAKIQVTAISSKTPVHVVTRSDEHGHFEAIGLVQGHYMLTAAAPGFVAPQPLKPIEAGKKDVHIILDSQVSARVRVFDKNGRLMTRYQVTVKSYFKAQDQIAASMIPAKAARPDRDGVFTVEGLDPTPKEYVLQIDAGGHAKAFTQPFGVAIGDEPPLLEVRLNEGGIIEGVVLDSRGQPLSDVLVQTYPNHLDDNPFTDMFGAMIPYRVTRTGTKTDAKGFYQIKMLNSGTYQLRFTHPEHYIVSLKDQELVEGERTTVAPMRLQRGTVVSGTVRVDGKPASQVKVTITAMGDPKVSNPSLFNDNAITGNDGTFVMDKRVPPGRYQVMGARQTLPNPLLQIADFNKTKQEITLAQGQEKYFLTINIASQ